MTLQDLTEHKIGILGFGQEGQAVFEYLTTHGYKAVIFDETPQSEWTAQALEIIAKSNAAVFSGADSFASIKECTLLFRSPGIWRNNPLLLAAENNGTIITSQVKWFFDNSPAKIIGVTGTKGKGTTCSLIYAGLQASNKSAYLTGNIGKQQPLEIIDALQPNDLVVYELSSFQLQDLTVSPHIGICLMVTSDHLNHHSNLKEYHGAKAAISAFQSSSDIMIFNSDYKASATIGGMGQGSKLSVSASSKPLVGAYITGENIEVTLLDEQQLIIDCSNRKLRGKHNLENIAAAALALLSSNVSPATITQTINDFAGLEHRLQFVGTYNDISFYNDSISTVPDTTIAAVRSFDEPIHLFLGGSDKGLTYETLMEALKTRANIASITLLGETGSAIKAEIEKADLTIPTSEPYTDFKQAIQDTVARAKPGEIVLLSPAAASFDMFKNYAERGREFIRLVQEITK